LEAIEVNFDPSSKATQTIVLPLFTDLVCSWKSHFPPCLSISHNGWQFLSCRRVQSSLELWTF